MKIIIATCFIIGLTSCATGTQLAVQEVCEAHQRKQSERRHADCVDIVAIGKAVVSDVKATNEALAAYEEHNAVIDPSHEGEDSDLCKTAERKVCSVNNGCNCEK